MQFDFKTKLGLFRFIALLEGLSFLILLFIAMPLKYGADMPEAVRMVGMAHGVLFVAYLFLLMVVRSEHNWSIALTIRSFLASILPFGTFYADKHWWKK
ncbi:MAG: DUF3817 domain-containing protein [Bacteroidetes bacterium]|nr:MAG: DUF3817 domain-containing protein [Bacteroidota bacterium]